MEETNLNTSLNETPTSLEALPTLEGGGEQDTFNFDELEKLSSLDTEEGSPASAEDTPPEGTVERVEGTPSDEKKFAGRYDTVEALEQGYKELQKQFTQLSQKGKKDLLDSVMAIQYPQAKETIPVQQPVPVNQQIPVELSQHPDFLQLQRTNPALATQVVAEYHRRMVPQQTIQPRAQLSDVESKVNRLVYAQEIASLQREFPDFDTIAEDIPALFAEKPYLLSSDTPLRDAYTFLKYQQMPTVMQDAVQQAQAQADKHREQKRTSVMESQTSGGKRTAKPKLSPEQEIMADILAQRGGLETLI